ncbi:MAG TPA: hypothetical protein VLT59_11285 [Steroidobacteraceae bacterium]|nr:hypothetical protein [Steroidobacteraceae bacterium]
MADDKAQEKPTVEKQAAGPAKEAPAPFYYLIIVGDGAPQIIRFEDKTGFRQGVQKHVLGAKETIYAFGFVGNRINITAPMPMCLVEVDGETVKLGDDSPQYEESGKIVPLVRQDDDA